LNEVHLRAPPVQFKARYRDAQLPSAIQQCRSHHDVVSSASRPAASFVVMFVVIRQLAEPSDDGTIARACDDVDGKVPVRR
jgi:hypothetical protein